jgi:hypothetical protein
MSVQVAITLVKLASTQAVVLVVTTSVVLECLTVALTYAHAKRVTMTLVFRYVRFVIPVV